MDTPTPGTLRIGELARRTGVSPEVLRAWEQRYGLLHPTRSKGGFRLYSDADERRVRITRALIAEGLSTAEAAARALSDARPSPSAEADAPLLERHRRALVDALDAFDAPAAQAALDDLLATMSEDALLVDVLLPYLRDLGDRWASGRASVGQEHFASNLVRGRLLGFARGWAANARASSLVLACPPGEAHDLSLIMFGIAAARLGYRIYFLGADTPVDTLAVTAAALHPVAVVLAVTIPGTLGNSAHELRALSRDVRLMVGGRAATAADAQAIGAELLEGDPISAASTLAWMVAAPAG
jgi:DNA-binding transcriptional MerR regulator